MLLPIVHHVMLVAASRARRSAAVLATMGPLQLVGRPVIRQRRIDVKPATQRAAGKSLATITERQRAPASRVTTVRMPVENLPPTQ